MVYANCVLTVPDAIFLILNFNRSPIASNSMLLFCSSLFRLLQDMLTRCQPRHSATAFLNDPLGRRFSTFPASTTQNYWIARRIKVSSLKDDSTGRRSFEISQAPEMNCICTAQIFMIVRLTDGQAYSKCYRDSEFYERVWYIMYSHVTYQLPTFIIQEQSLCFRVIPQCR